jgi:transcriptional regulator with GAF, ATPase, and Fis domain
MERSSLKVRVEQLERDEMLRALREHGGVKARAAKALGLTERMFNYRLRKYGLAVVRKVEAPGRVKGHEGDQVRR